MITIGYIELNSIAKGVEAADTVLKAADTELLLAKPCCPGKFQILFPLLFDRLIANPCA